MSWLPPQEPSHNQSNYLNTAYILTYGPSARLSFWLEKHVDNEEYGASVECYWQGKTETFSVSAPFFHYKSHMNLPAIEPQLQW